MKGAGFLFGAASRDEERALRDALDGVQGAAGRAKKTGKNEALFFDERCALLLAWMVEIGAAPKKHALVDALRRNANETGAASLVIASDASDAFLEYLRSGIARHEAGVTDPAGFRLH